MDRELWMKTIKQARAHLARRPDEARAQGAPQTQEAEAVVETPILIATKIFNAVVPICFVLFAWHHAAAFFQTLRLSNLIVLVQTVLVLQFYVRKTTAPFVSTSAYAWFIALSGTVAPLMFRPTRDPLDFQLATVLQVIGGAMQIYVISTLGFNSGSTAARRGIRRDSWYRFVRHPLYLTLMLSQYGYVLNHTSFYNILVCAFAIFFHVLRINEEERLLQEDPEFQEYVEQTPWRLFPKVY